MTARPLPGDASIRTEHFAGLGPAVYDALDAFDYLVSH